MTESNPVPSGTSAMFGICANLFPGMTTAELELLVLRIQEEIVWRQPASELRKPTSSKSSEERRAEDALINGIGREPI